MNASPGLIHLVQQSLRHPADYMPSHEYIDWAVQERACWLMGFEHAMQIVKDYIEGRVDSSAPVPTAAAAPSEDHECIYENGDGICQECEALAAIAKAAQLDERAAFEAWAKDWWFFGDLDEQNAESAAWEGFQQGCAYSRAAAPQATVKGDEPVPFRGPAKFTEDEVADGNRGIRWAMADGVYGRPSDHDVREYLEGTLSVRGCTCSECLSFYTSKAAPQAGATLTTEQIDAIREQFHPDDMPSRGTVAVIARAILDTHPTRKE